MQQLIDVQLAGQTLSVPSQTTVGQVIADNMKPSPRSILAAFAHQRCVGLDFPICAPTEIRPVDYTMREGVLVYRRTASLVLLEAARRLYPTVRVTIGQAMGNGYFYNIRNGSVLNADQLRQLDRVMHEIVNEDLPLRREMVHVDKARHIFAKLGCNDKLQLLKTWWEPFVELVWCGDFCDIHYYPVAPSTRYVEVFETIHYPPGLILRFPTRWMPQEIRPYQDTPKLFQAYSETRQWNEILGVETVGNLNELTVKGEASNVLRVAEGLHEKKVAQIADQIAERRGRVRLVLIAGPSASGKTTFAKRLGLQLAVNGIRPVALSTDNFYVNRKDTPLDENGRYDFECIEAIDLDLFNATLEALLRGERVLSPRYGFNSGKRKPEDRWTPMQLEPGQVLVVEGIHGLNSRLTASVSEDQKFGVYVSALTQLSIDDHNRIFTSDTRFLRRIVRDRLFRGYSASQTIESWPRVRRGELRNIFPFQEHADVMFNSALVYEQAVLRLYAERFLLEVPQDDPTFVDAYRLLSFVQNFVPMFDEKVPQISILREFIGGSAFDY